jgi:putative ABC transport system permease protein
MKTLDLTELAGRNLRESLLRNSLTTMGIAVGVASLVAMLSLGVGLQNLVNSKLTHSGLFDAVFVSANMRERGFERPRAAIPGDEASHPLDEDARLEMTKLANVVDVYPEIRVTTEVRYEGKLHSASLAGLPQLMRTDSAFEWMKGDFFSSATADETILQVEFARDLSDQPETLLGKELILRYAERQALPAEPDVGGGAGATKRGPAENPVGDSGENGLPGGFSVIPREKKLKIVGIIETEVSGGFGTFGRGRVFVPIKIAQDVQAGQTSSLQDLLRGNGAKSKFTSLTVRVNDPKNVEVVENAIKKMGFSTFSLLDASHNLALVFRVFDSLLGIFGSLALVVASLGIINTLVMAILERRREIGVLKALGAADRDIQRLFFAEAGAMGLMGGVLGVVLGWAIGRAISAGINVYLHSIDLPSTNVSSVPWWMVGSAIGFAFLVSLAAGIYPASRAARLNPVEALRYE